MRRRLLVGNQCNINFDIIDKSDTVAGDICIVCNSTSDKYFIEPDTISLINSEEFTPIGVVVVPASHTDDGTARVMSLSAMDYNNPDRGNFEENLTMAWGGSGYDIPNLPYLIRTPYIATSPSALTASEQSIVGWQPTTNYYTAIPSDYLTSNQNPYDTNSYYGDTEYDCAPSPYLQDGSRNELYHSTENTGNILADMNGKSNTEKILSVDNSSSTDWQTAATITNTGRTETIHPAAQCCWRYHTIGTTQGDWYLPASGELGYLGSRFKAINSSIQKIADNGFAALLLNDSDWVWSSSSSSSTRGHSLVVDKNSEVEITDSFFKYNTSYSYVRSFIAL